MASGLLTGKFTRDSIAELPGDDMRHRNDHFREPELSANLALIESLRPLAARHGRTVGQLAIAWVLRRREVTAAIVGARHPSQVAEIASAADCALTKEEITEIDALLAA